MAAAVLVHPRAARFALWSIAASSFCCYLCASSLVLWNFAVDLPSSAYTSIIMHTISSGSSDASSTVDPLPPAPSAPTPTAQKTWMQEEEWNFCPPDDVAVHLQDDIEAALRKVTELSTPLGLDANRYRHQGCSSATKVRFHDVVRTSANEAGDQQGYPAGIPNPGPDLQPVIAKLLEERDKFEAVDVMYLIVDSRTPEQVDYWPAFRPWWKGRRQLLGPRREITDLFWFCLNDQSGLDRVPHVWAGTFVLECCRYLFPKQHLILIDTDCVPVTLFEVQDLVQLCKGLPVPQDLVHPVDQGTPGMILVSEHSMDLNAGFVLSLAETEEVTQPDLACSAKELVLLLRQSRKQLLQSSAPRTNPTALAKGGLLGTPLLDIECRTSLDLCHSWAILGEYLIRLCWPIPQNWQPGQAWPRCSSDHSLAAEARARKPAYVEWARVTFEQGALSVLPFLNSLRSVYVLPGPDLFQANALRPEYMRPAIYHSFGKAKRLAHGTLSFLLGLGWEPLGCTLAGVEDVPAAWQRSGWRPAGGVCWHGEVPGSTLSASARHILLMAWIQRTPPVHELFQAADALPPFLAWASIRPFFHERVGPKQRQSQSTPQSGMDVQSVHDSSSESEEVDAPNQEQLFIAEACQHQQQLAHECATHPALKEHLPCLHGIDSCMQALAEALALVESAPSKHHMLRVTIDCPGLGGESLGLEPSADLTLCTPRVGRGHVLYGPSLAPVDQDKGEIHTGLGWSVAVHNFAQFMVTAYASSHTLWELLTGIKGTIILHRTCLVLRAARRLPVHRHRPRPQFVTAVAFKLLHLHPGGPLWWLRLMGLQIHQKDLGPTHLVIRGFSAGSYTGAAVCLIADAMSRDFVCTASIGAIAMAPTVLLGLCRLSRVPALPRRPPHIIRLTHFASDELCKWHPTALLLWLGHQLHLLYVEGRPHNWGGKSMHNYVHLITETIPPGIFQVTQLATRFVEARPLRAQVQVPLRLTCWMRGADTIRLQDLTSLLRLDTPELIAALHDVATDLRRPAPEDEATAVDTVLAGFSIRLSSDRTSRMAPVEQWLTAMARQLLAPLPLRELLVLLHAFIPQITYGSANRFDLLGKKSITCANSQITLTPTAIGQHGIREYSFQHHAPSQPLGVWVPPSCPDPDVITLEDWHQYNSKAIETGLDWGDVLLVIVHCGKVAHTEEEEGFLFPGQPFGASRDNVESQTNTLAPSQDQLWAFTGIFTDLERPDSGQDPWKRCKVRKATLTCIPGTESLIESSGLAPFLEGVYCCPPLQVTSMDHALSFKLHSIYKLGPTVCGSQLLQVANLAPQHKPLVLGISRPLSTPPFVVHRSQELISSLRMLLEMLLTREVPAALERQQAFCHQIMLESDEDSGHLVTFAVSVLVSLLSGRAAQIVEGLFGAGKTTSLVLMLGWFVLTTPASLCFTVASRENPAGQALAAQVMRLTVPDDIKLQFVRTCSQKEMEELGTNCTLIDVKTRDAGPRLSHARVLIATTGTIHENVEGYPREFGEHLARSSIFVHEEGQQAIEYKSAVAVSCPRVPCLYILVGDGNQAPGGVDSRNQAAIALRAELMKLPIGLRAKKRTYTPATFTMAIARLVDHIEGLDRSDLLHHAQSVSQSSVFAQWRDADHLLPDNAQSIWDWMAPMLPRAVVCNLDSPVATLVALGFLLSATASPLLLQVSATAAASAGVEDGPHLWSIMLPTTTRVTPVVYESLVGAFYPDLVQHDAGQWSFGTGTRNLDRQEAHGFRYIYWHDADRRRPRHERVATGQRNGRFNQESAKAIMAVYETAHTLMEHIPAYHPQAAATTPGQLLMTNTNHQRNVLSSSAVAPSLPARTPNPRYRLVEEQASGFGPERHSNSTIPQYLDKVPLKVENTVKLAGATCYRSFLIQAGVSFLSGSHKYTEEKNFEAYARANVGLSRAIGATIIVSPVDMRGLIGMAQVLATIQAGLCRIDTDSGGVVLTLEAQDKVIQTDRAMTQKLEGATFGAYPLPLSLAWASRSDTGVQVLRLHLMLIEARGFEPSVTDHPAFPGGRFIGLLWGYALDNDRRALWEVRPSSHRDGEWYLLHANRRLDPRIAYPPSTTAHVMWTLHRGHFYDSWAITPRYNEVGLLLGDRTLPQLQEVSSNHLRGFWPMTAPRPTAISIPSISSTALQSEVASTTSSSSTADQQDRRVRGTNKRRHPAAHRSRRTKAPFRIVRNLGTLNVVMEPTDAVAYPCAEHQAEGWWERAGHLCQAFSKFASHCFHATTFDASSRAILPVPTDLALLPPEWPMGRLNLKLPHVSRHFKQQLYRSTIQRKLTEGHQPSNKQIHTSDILDSFVDSTKIAGELIASFFRGIDAPDSMHELVCLAPEWGQFASPAFWHKCVIAEVASVINASKELKTTEESVPFYRASDPSQRESTTISTFVVVQDRSTDLKSGLLPLVDLKVYFPMAFFDTVLRNSGAQGFRGSYMKGDLGGGDIAVRKPQPNSSHTIMVIKQGHAASPPFVSQTLVPPKYPLTRELYGTGLLSSSLAALLGAGRTMPTIQIEVKAPQIRANNDPMHLPETTHTLEDFLPQPWDLMRLAPGKLMALSNAFFGPSQTVDTVLERYRTFICEAVLRHFKLSNLTELFNRQGRIAPTDIMLQNYDDPGWNSPSPRGGAEYNEWYDRHKGFDHNYQQIAATRLGNLKVYPLIAQQTYKPWSAPVMALKSRGRSTQSRANDPSSSQHTPSAAASSRATSDSEHTRYQ